MQELLLAGVLIFEITSCVREVFGWPFVECPTVSFNFCGGNKHLVFDGCGLVSVDLKRLYCTSSVVHHVVVPDQVVYLLALSCLDHVHFPRVASLRSAFLIPFGKFVMDAFILRNL